MVKFSGSISTVARVQVNNCVTQVVHWQQCQFDILHFQRIFKL